MSEEKIYTVTAVTRMIKYTLEETFPSVWVEGEISNYVHHTSGHRYLSLKDENAVIKLTIWRSSGQYLKFEPQDGMKVRAFGDISVYEKGGSYQLNVKKLIPIGVGELEIAFRQLYEKLLKEGLFDAARKNPIPQFPLKVGIVTSPTGAAIRDMIRIAQRRNDIIQLILFPAQVQGDGAENSIIAGINYFNQRSDVDVIITGRGGGSLEDLWAFNMESVVRAIAESKKPIVTAIGHEIDTTLSDLAADLRASTPSAAAELVIWDKKAVLTELKDLLSRMRYSLSETAKNKRHNLEQIMKRSVYTHPENLIRNKEQYFDNLKKRFTIGAKNLLDKQKNNLSLAVSRLESLSPLAILNRGFAVLKGLHDGVPVKSVLALKVDMLLEATLSDGIAITRVMEIKKKEDGQ